MKAKHYLIIYILLLALSVSVFSGCSNKDNSLYAHATSANYEFNLIEARVGDIICLSTNPFNVLPDDTQVKSVFSSSNPTIASVNTITGEVTCLNEGTVTIYGHVKRADDSIIGDSFTLHIREKLYYATDFFLQNEKKVMLGLEDENVINPITYFGENVNVFPTISYSNSSVASYNYQTGKITPKALGQTTVYVMLELENEVKTKTFIIEVVQKMVYIEVDDTFETLVGEYIFIEFEIIDNTQESGLIITQKVTIDVLANENLIEIVQNDFQAILIRAKQTTGTVFLKLSYLHDETITKTIAILIK